MRYGEVVNEVTSLMEKFQQDKQCLEAFTTEAAKDIKNLSSDEKAFVVETFHGCITYKSLLDIVVEIFYLHHKEIRKVDRNLFSVVTYLSMFSLDKYGLKLFSRIIQSLDALKMLKFLSFFFNINILTTQIKQEWSEIYDVSVVNDNWITPLMRWCDSIQTLVDQLAIKTGKTNLPRPAIKGTKPMEFNLTQPKPRPGPAPEVIPQQEKAKPMPASTYQSPKEFEILLCKKEENRQKALRDLNKSNSEQFRCANTQKSEKTLNMMSEIHQRREAELKFDERFTSGCPATQKMTSIPVKMNSAALFRKKALNTGRLEEDIERPESLFQGAAKTSAFFEWQKQMKAKDLQEKLNGLERRRLEVQISHKEATLAQRRVLERNHHKAQETKEESAELIRKYAEKLTKAQHMRQLVQQVADGQKNSKAARAKLQEMNQLIVKEVSEQSRDLLRQALEEAQAQLSRKMELISQIREFQSAALTRQPKSVDHTESAGHNLLCEMSQAELSERLLLLRELEKCELEERRSQIHQEKQRKEQMLLETLDTIALQSRLREQADLCRNERKLKSELQESVKKEKNKDLQKILEQKQREIQKLKSEKLGAKRNKKASHIIPKKKVLDEQDWLDLEHKMEKQLNLMDQKYVSK